MRKKIADKKEVQAFLTSVLRDPSADVKDRLKVSECLLKLADEGDAPKAQNVEVKISVVD